MVSLRGRVPGIAASVALTAGAVLLWPGAASAVTCPVVARGTGTVTPAPAPGVDWSHCHLAGANLSGADLSGANLGYTDLSLANMTGANLSGASLADADIDNADLAGADLSATVMNGISRVLGVRSGGITGVPASLPVTQFGGVSLIGGYLAGADADLNNADLASADLAGIDFEAATFAGANLAGANLAGASVDGDLADASLSGTNLTNAYLAGVSSGGITGTPAHLPSGWLLVMGYLIGPDAQVTQADLTGANLAGADMHMINLDGTNLTDADLAGANLEKAGLTSATLTGADLSGADLAGLLSGSITGMPAALPASWTLRNGYLFGPKAWLYAADLSGQDLSGLDLAGADLESSNLTGANLSGTNATGADLAGARIAQADLAQTALTGASLYVIRSGGGMTGTPASLPAGWTVRSGWLIGPSVFLEHDNLNGVNLSGVDMAGAETDWTTFTGANLSGTDLAGAFLWTSDFTNAGLGGADLFGASLNSDTWTGAACPDGTSASSHGGTCAGALAFRFGGFITPKPGSTVAASTKHVIVHFKFATTSGAAIPASVAAAIGRAEEVRATLAGAGIKAVRVYCSWASARSEFTCTIPDPPGIRKGTSHSYTITVAEKPGSTFQTAPRLGKAVNPETIHFG